MFCFERLSSFKSKKAARKRMPGRVPDERKLVAVRHSWGYSSVGRAPVLQAGGQEFESLYLHHFVL